MRQKTQTTNYSINEAIAKSADCGSITIAKELHLR